MLGRCSWAGQVHSSWEELSLPFEALSGGVGHPPQGWELSQESAWGDGLYLKAPWELHQFIELPEG